MERAAATGHARDRASGISALKNELTVETRNAERGIALIMVMIIILTLSAIVGGFAYAMKVEMRWRAMRIATTT